MKPTTALLALALLASSALAGCSAKRTATEERSASSLSRTELTVALLAGDSSLRSLSLRCDTLRIVAVDTAGRRTATTAYGATVTLDEQRKAALAVDANSASASLDSDASQQSVSTATATMPMPMIVAACIAGGAALLLAVRRRRDCK